MFLVGWRWICALWGDETVYLCIPDALRLVQMNHPLFQCNLDGESTYVTCLRSTSSCGSVPAVKSSTSAVGSFQCKTLTNSELESNTDLAGRRQEIYETTIVAVHENVDLTAALSSADDTVIDVALHTFPKNNLQSSEEVAHSLDSTFSLPEGGFCDFSEAEYFDCEIDRDDNVSVTSDLEYNTCYDSYAHFSSESDPSQQYHDTEDTFFDASQTFLPEDQSETFGAQDTSSSHPSLDPPLYNGANVTVSETSIAFLSFMLSNDISGEVLARLLAFIQLILPADNKFFSTLHSFFKYFENLKYPLNFIYDCSSCMRGLDRKDSVCTRCGPNVKVSYYLNLPLIPQIKSLYSNPAFVEALSYRFNRKKIVEDNLEDIYDGEMYKSASDILSQPFNISLFWNTDGISLFKSSNFQVWPFYFVINELPPHLRFKEEYMILAGIAFGNGKPAGNVFLKPILQETEILKNGIYVTMPHSDVPINIKCIVLCGSCDAQAKSSFMRLTHFNGHHGCPRCLARGQWDNEGRVFTYPFQENISQRTLEGYKEQLNAVRDNGGKTAVYGVQGSSYLFKMVWTFFLSSTAVDVMHAVYLGVCRQLFFLWFSSRFIKEVFGENAERKTLIEKLSSVLCNFEAPHYLSRAPRSLLNVKYFKAAEFRTWLFSTALPLLEKYMKEPYLGHLKKLVCALCLLNQASVSRQDIELASSLLISFVCEFQVLYGIRNMSFNVHCLLHLPDVTLALGPLWVSSCFGFEALNGRLARLVHGTRHAGLQIYSHLGLLRNLHSLINSLANMSVKEFCKSMVLKSKQFKVAGKLGRRVLIGGDFVQQHFLPPHYNDSLCRATSVGANYFFFFRLKMYEFLYVAEDYGKGSRNSSFVKYTSDDGDTMYGRVKVFVKVTSCQCKVNCDHIRTYFALISLCPFIQPIQMFQSYQFCRVSPVTI